MHDTQPQWWPGVFRPLLHAVMPSSAEISFHAVSIRFAECNAATEPPFERSGGTTAVYCSACFRILLARKLISAADLPVSRLGERPSPSASATL